MRKLIERMESDGRGYWVLANGRHGVRDSEAASRLVKTLLSSGRTNICIVDAGDKEMEQAFNRTVDATEGGRVSESKNNPIAGVAAYKEAVDHLGNAIRELTFVINSKWARMPGTSSEDDIGPLKAIAKELSDRRDAISDLMAESPYHRIRD